MRWIRGYLNLVGTRSTCLELAVLAFVDKPVSAGVAHGADPLDQGRLGLEKVEGMVAVPRDSHCALEAGAEREVCGGRSGRIVCRGVD